jgi:hypothetical protein
MSDREKNLLLFFGVAGFIILNFLAFNFAMSKRAAVNSQRSDAQSQLALADVARQSSDEVADEMEWLAKHEPEPAASQDVQNKLLQFSSTEATQVALTVKTSKPLPVDQTLGKTYHRAKFQFVVTGTEEALYRWFDRLNDPTALRAVTQILLSPNKQDDTKIDCTATVEQWFIPPTT